MNPPSKAPTRNTQRIQPLENANKFTILHQNIRGISNKIDEFLNSVSPNAPHIICLTEHHLRTEELSNVNSGHYSLGASFCRQTYNHGGV